MLHLEKQKPAQWASVSFPDGLLNSLFGHLKKLRLSYLRLITKKPCNSVTRLNSREEFPSVNFLIRRVQRQLSAPILDVRYWPPA